MFQTEQEQFWAGQFGTEYTQRNSDDRLIAANTFLFGEILSRTVGIQSAVEFGANRGFNLRALRRLLAHAELEGVEINKAAADVLREWGRCTVREMSVLDYEVKRQFDLAFTKGLLIHTGPESLPKVYDLLYAVSRRYIVIAEYYSPSPVEVVYRGHQGKLFKRDFAGELMDRFGDVSLVHYGFGYHRDPNFPLDDITWFLLEKRPS